jgi:hypothetical protein
MVFSRRLSGDENRIGRNKFGVSGVLQNLFVATAARLCGHGGKNTVVCWFGLRAIAQAPHQPYGLSSAAQSLRHAVAARWQRQSGRSARFPRFWLAKAESQAKPKRLNGHNMENALALGPA